MADQAVTLTAEERLRAIADLVNLDNVINDAESMPNEGDTVMARQKHHITLPDGKKIWVTGESLQSVINNAVKQSIAYVASLDMLKLKKQIKLKDYIENEYKPTYFEGLAATTKDTQNQYLRDNVYPFLGDMFMTDITVKTIQDFYNWMAEGKKYGRKKNLSAGTINNVTKVINKIFNVAVATHYISENPINRKLLKNPGEKSKHHKAIPKETAQSVRERIPSLTDERQRLFMGLLAYDTGMRPEEILGLRWEDVDFENGCLDIKRTPPRTSIRSRGTMHLIRLSRP